MKYLKDTCVFIYKIDTANEILDVARHCENIGSKLCVTNVVMDELSPGPRVPKEKAEKSKDIKQYLEFGCESKIVNIINIDEIEKYKRNLQNIRRRYYDHLRDPDELNELIEKGLYTKEQVRSAWFRNKDMGECSCIAIAMEDPKGFVIVTDDKGRIFLKPDINLFEMYKDSHDITVLNYEQWINETEYKLMESEVVVDKS